MMIQIALVLSLVVASGALAINPSLSGGGGGTNVLNSGREVVWSEPPNLDGLIGSSEVIWEFYVVTELANDFFLTTNHGLDIARWWGGYFYNSSCGDVGVATNWNLTFYDDVGCIPEHVLYERMGVDANETFVYCQSDVYPIFSYEVADLNFTAQANTRYWFVAQAADHTFPPQVGRVASAGVVGCETVFRGSYFSYNYWTPVIDVFGVAFDASQEFEEYHIVPTERTTWGAVKELYR